jgi:hypothetical protein
MIERFRVFLDQPLGHGAARAILCFSSAILLGLALLFVLAASQPGRPTPPDRVSSAASPKAPRAWPPAEALRSEQVGAIGRQDPQDVPGSPAARRAARALQSHRALQHVPFESEDLTVELVGARRHRAVLRVTASTIGAARQGWRKFLRRYQDAGHAYIPIFNARGGTDG